MSIRVTPLRAALLGAAIVVAGAVAFVLVARSEPPPDRGPVIARAGGTPIYLADARARVAGLSSVHGDISETLGEDWPDKVLQSLVDNVIIERAAEDAGITLSDQQIEEGVNKLRSDFSTEADFQAWLEKQGADIPELERRIRLQLLSSRVYFDVTGDVTASNDEIRAYYKEHVDDYTANGRVTPLLEVRNDIEETLDQRDKDQAFADWLDQQRSLLSPVVVMEDWWRRV